MLTLRDLPGIDRLLRTPELQVMAARYGAESVKAQLRDLQQLWRSRGEVPDWAVDAAACAVRIEHVLEPRGYRVVFNLTGTLIHTNLGRAPLDADMLDAVRNLVSRPMNLEYDLASGRRGDREGPVARRLALLTRAEAATVVNNNAAALMLVLNTFGRGRRVPVSRGELIEIGGSFRLPELMERAGCDLLEIGTTNRTHLRDYERAAEGDAGLLLKVHPSNYQISGFTATVGVPQLAALGRRLALPVCVDLGSGTLVDLERWGLPHEPTPGEVLAQGADLVTFSGDKLLGSVQAGLIVGRHDLIDALNRNPMKRALRTDKLTLALLERTLALYEEPDRLAEKLPLLRLLTAPRERLHAYAERVRSVLASRLSGIELEITASACQIGSGALPEQRLASLAVVLRHPEDGALRGLQDALRALPVPVIGRIHQRALWLDMRGAEPVDELCASLGTLEFAP